MKRTLLAHMAFSLALSLPAACTPTAQPEAPTIPPPPGPMLRSEATRPAPNPGGEGDAPEPAPRGEDGRNAGAERRAAPALNVAPPEPIPQPLEAPVGDTLAQARQHDLFRQFHLRETVRTALNDGTVAVTFRPASPRFAPLVEVIATVDRDEVIRDFLLVMKRSFVDAKATNQLARDLALVFLRSAVSRVDGGSVSPLAIDIYDRGRRPAASPPTQAFEVFAGRRPKAHVDFSYSHVTFSNQAGQGGSAPVFVVFVEPIPPKGPQAVWN